MKITAQIAVESTPGQPEVIQQVARLERGPSLRPATLGLSLAEARAILAGLEQSIVERQCAEWVALEQRCPGAASRAPARATIRSCSVPLLVNWRSIAHACTVARAGPRR